ncbi:MAG: hypothetical protein HC914_10290, partial [Chloroflexaceae bacterium]|nr:hypothetical protein [Chloroflexaceae bacterium]
MAYDRSASIALLQPEELPLAHGPVAVFQRWAAALPNPTHPSIPHLHCKQATLDGLRLCLWLSWASFSALFFLVD